MSRFRGTYDGKKDGKNRISIPAAYRNALKSDDSSENLRLVLRPSHKFPCIEGWSRDGFDEQEQMLAALPRFSEAEEDLALVLNSDASDVEADATGRIVLPIGLISFAELGDQVTFLSAGSHFQIWNSDAASARMAEARANAKLTRMILPALRPTGGGQ